MVVAVQSGLDYIKHELSLRGYTVVDLENYGYPVDALVYKDHFTEVSYITGNNMPVMSKDDRSSYGVFMINASGKSIDDIEWELGHRCYSPLF